MAWTSGMPTIVPGPFSRQQPRRMRCAVHGQTCAPDMLDLVLPGNLVRRRGDADDERRIHRFCQLDLRRFDRRAVPLSEDLSAAGRGGGWRLDRLLRAKADHRTAQCHRPAAYFAIAHVKKVVQDLVRADHFYAQMTGYMEFD